MNSDEQMNFDDDDDGRLLRGRGLEHDNSHMAENPTAGWTEADNKLSRSRCRPYPPCLWWWYAPRWSGCFR